MLKAFQYTSIALLCSMTVACSSGKGNSTSQTQHSNKPILEKPQTGKTENTENRKQETPKQEIPKQETPKQETPKQEIPKQETPKQETPKQEIPKQETPKQETPKQETPKQEIPKQEIPKQETPKQESPKQEIPKQEIPKQETPKPEIASKFVVTAQETKLQDGYISQNGDYQGTIETLVSIAEKGGVNFKHLYQTVETKDVNDRADDDVGLSLLKANDQSISSGFGRVHQINIAGQLNVLLARDADLNNWKYQDFGLLTLASVGSSAFVSFGQESKSIPESGNATYKGIALGSAWDGDKPIDSVSGQIASNVEMAVDFSNKNLTFITSNTKGYRAFGAESDVSARIIDYSNGWDLKGTAKWNQTEKAFVGKVQLKSDVDSIQPNADSLLKGSFYGPGAVEIGGTFHLKTNDKDYRGAFGANKEVKTTEVSQP